MTPDQLINLYNETRRQEAREILNFYQAISITKTDENSRERAIESLQMEAYPFDPEADGDFGKEEISVLKKVIE